MNLFETLVRKTRFTYLRMTSIRKKQQVKKAVLDYYRKHPSSDEEIKEAIQYLNGHEFSAFLHPFKDKYIQKKVVVQTDKEQGLYYVERDHKRLYLCRSKTFIGAQHTYNNLLIEQDLESPHRYLTDSFKVNENDVLVDIGCAEGILSLDLVDKVKKLYLFECEDEWIEALTLTFAPWKDKVEIIKKYVSDTDDEQNITLDTFFKNKADKPTFIKMDVEGAEMQVLHGMQSLLNSEVKMVVCTYHRKGDYEEITRFVTQKGMEYTSSKKYMLFQDGKDFLPPYFRRGLIRVTAHRKMQENGGEVIQEKVIE